MNITQETAMKLWNDVFGNVIWAQDCFGTWIHKSDYGDKDTTRTRLQNNTAYNYGWDIDHILPVSRNGKDHWNNLEPMHWSNNQQNKSDNINFHINDVPYQVVKCNICSSHKVYGFGIKNQATNERVDWKGTSRRFYNI